MLECAKDDDWSIRESLIIKTLHKTGREELREKSKKGNLEFIMNKMNMMKRLFQTNNQHILLNNNAIGESVFINKRLKTTEE